MFKDGVQGKEKSYCLHCHYLSKETRTSDTKRTSNKVSKLISLYQANGKRCICSDIVLTIQLVLTHLTLMAEK